MLRRPYLTLAGLAIFLAGVTTAQSLFAEPRATSSSNIQIRARMGSVFPSPALVDNEDYTDVVTNNTGAFVQSNRSRVVFADGGIADGDSPGFAETYGEAQLSSGTLKSYSYSRVDVSDFQFNVDSIQVTSFTSVTIGDSFSTTTGSGSPFNWGAGGIGTFNLDLGGDFFKAFLDGDGVLERGTASWSVGLVLTTPEETTARFTWGAGIGGFEAGEPFRIYTTTAAHGDACIVCEASMPTDISGAVVPTGIPVNDNLTARFNVGGDFDWTLSLSTSTSIRNQTDEVKSNYFNTLNASYQGPAGSLTNAAVFGAFSPAAPVPLPASFYLLGVSLLGLLRHRKKVLLG